MELYTGFGFQGFRNPNQRMIHVKATPGVNDVVANLIPQAEGNHGNFICPEAVAWKSLTVWGTLSGATVKFRVRPALQLDGADIPWQDYPGAASAAANTYTKAGVTAAGIYNFETVLGNLFGNIEWSGGDENTDFWAYVSYQMV